jgi:hypothetical protein
MENEVILFLIASLILPQRIFPLFLPPNQMMAL